MKTAIDDTWIKQLYDTFSDFAQIPENEWNKLLKKLYFLKLKKNEYFINAGDVPDKIAFIISGIFRVFYTTESGVERVIAIRAENCALASYSSFWRKQSLDFIFRH